MCVHERARKCLKIVVSNIKLYLIACFYQRWFCGNYIYSTFKMSFVIINLIHKVNMYKVKVLGQICSDGQTDLKPVKCQTSFFLSCNSPVKFYFLSPPTNLLYHHHKLKTPQQMRSTFWIRIVQPISTSNFSTKTKGGSRGSNVEKEEARP